MNLFYRSQPDPPPATPVLCPRDGCHSHEARDLGTIFNTYRDAGRVSLRDAGRLLGCAKCGLVFSALNDGTVRAHSGPPVAAPAAAQRDGSAVLRRMVGGDDDLKWPGGNR